jgi:hypothetical protein
MPATVTGKGIPVGVGVSANTKIPAIVTDTRKFLRSLPKRRKSQSRARITKVMGSKDRVQNPKEGELKIRDGDSSQSDKDEVSNCSGYPVTQKKRRVRGARKPKEGEEIADWSDGSYQSDREEVEDDKQGSAFDVTLKKSGVVLQQKEVNDPGDSDSSGFEDNDEEEDGGKEKHGSERSDKIESEEEDEEEDHPKEEHRPELSDASRSEVVDEEVSSEEGSSGSEEVNELAIKVSERDGESKDSVHVETASGDKRVFEAALDSAESQAEKILLLEKELLATKARETLGLDKIASQAETILGLEKDLSAMKARESLGVNVEMVTERAANENKTIQEAHDEYVEACSRLLDQLQVGLGGVAVRHRSAWESVSKMSKIMSTLSDLQLYLLAKSKSLSLSNEAVLTSHYNRMKVVMLDFQRVLYRRPTPTDKNVQYGYVPRRKDRGDKGNHGDDSLDCVQWIEKLVDEDFLEVLEKCLIKFSGGGSGSNLEVVEAVDGGVGVATKDATSEFRTRLDGLKDGLFVPWVSDTGEKIAAKADEKSSGVTEKQPTDLKRTDNSSEVSEGPNKKQKVVAQASTLTEPVGTTVRETIKTRSRSNVEKTK